MLKVLVVDTDRPVADLNHENTTGDWVRMDRGSIFTMIKFGLMVVDAEQKRAELLIKNEGAGPLFEMHHDPRKPLAVRHGLNHRGCQHRPRRAAGA